jgi:AhpD family alkylhydroperoxidase
MKGNQRLDYRAVGATGVTSLDALHGYVLSRSQLPRRLVELVFLRASQINGCAYCMGAHSRKLLEKGLTADQLALVPVWREAGDLFDEQERAALAWTEAVTNLGEHGVPDESFAAAAARFGEKSLVDLTLAIALMNAYNRLAIGFRTTPEALAI